MFDIKRDIEIEQAGGFFCHACLVSKPAGEQSPNPRYCQGCYADLKTENTVVNDLPKDYWSKDGLFFVHYNQKWGVDKNLATVCLGPVTESSSGVGESPPAKEKPVSKPLAIVVDDMTKTEGVLKL